MTHAALRLLPAGLVLSLAAVLSGCGPNLLQLGRRPTAYGGCCGLLWLLLAVTALLDVWKSGRPDSDKVIWTVVIVFIPIAGAIVYHLVAKGKGGR